MKMYLGVKSILISKMLQDVFKFVSENSMIEIAVAFIMGLQIKDLVTSFISSWITPFLAAIGGQPSFEGLVFEINNSRFTYGSFFNVLISTLILLVVLYYALILPLIKYKKAHSTLKTCEQCKCEVPGDAVVCKYCKNFMDAQVHTEEHA